MNLKYFATLVIIGLVVIGARPAKSEFNTQQTEQGVILIEEPRILDGRLLEKGISEQSLAETLHFVISGEVDLRSIVVGRGRRISTLGSNEFRLSGTVQRVEDSSVWTGEVVDSTGGIGRIGPVKIFDSNGFQQGALTEIATLLRAHLRLGSSAVARSVAVVLGCIEHQGPLATAVFQDLQGRLASTVDRVSGIHWKKSNTGKCESGSPPDVNEAIINGRIENREKTISIKLLLAWNKLAPQLPDYAGSLFNSEDDLAEYFEIISRAIAAIILEYPIEAVQKASLSASLHETQVIAAGRELLREQRPYLALPLLQHSARSRDLDALYDLGTAYQQVSAPHHAERIFRKMIRIDPNLGRAHKELGIILFNQRKFEEASKELRRAHDVPGAREKLATVLYLLGDRELAREKALEAVSAGENSPELNLLLARLDLSSGRLAAAIERLNDGLGKAQDTAYAQLFKEIAIRAMRTEEYTVAEKALQPLLSRDPDAEALTLQARIAMQRAYSSRFTTGTQEAVEFFRKATSAPEPEYNNNPELLITPLELAEALFTNGNYPEADATAKEFLIKAEVPNPRWDLSGYKPVAKLIVTASRFLEGQLIQPPLKALEDQLEGPQTPPELYVVVPLATRAEPLRVKVAEWSFDIFDEYVCTRVPAPQRTAVRELSALVQQAARTSPEKCQ